jgi:uncharacterized protein with PhoU and TrkA domain
MMGDRDYVAQFWTLLLVGCVVYALAALADRVAQLEQDVDHLTLAGDTPLARAARRLADERPYNRDIERGEGT